MVSRDTDVWTLILLRGPHRSALSLRVRAPGVLVPAAAPVALFALGIAMGMAWAPPQAGAAAARAVPERNAASRTTAELARRNDSTARSATASSDAARASSTVGSATGVAAGRAMAFEVDPGSTHSGQGADGFDPEVTEDERCSGRKVPDAQGFGKRVALTFDDGPHLQATPRIVEILRAHDAPATFFINGAVVTEPKHREIVESLKSDPLFAIGSHGWSHQNLEKIDAAGLAEEVDRNKGFLTESGIDAPFFRFPFGRASCDARRFVERRGYTVVGWHVNSADWCFSEQEGYCEPKRHRWVPDELRNDMAGYVMQQVRKHGGGVVLFHDRLAFTADQLERVLEQLEAEEFQIVRLDDSKVFPKLNLRRRARARTTEKGNDHVQQEG